MNTTIKRLKSDTPPYFKQLRFYAYFIGAVLGSIGTFLTSIPEVPSWIKLTIGGLVVVCGTIAGFTYLTTTDNNISKE